MNGNGDPRVIIISPTESDLTERGKRHPDLALLLVDGGWDVHYVSTTFNHATKTVFDAERVGKCKAQLPYTFTALEVGAYQRNISLTRVRWNRRFAQACYAHLKTVVRKGDIVIAPSRPPELVYTIARLKRQMGVRAILDIRDVWPDALSTSSRLKRTAFSVYCNSFLRPAVGTFDQFVHTAPSFLPWLGRYAPGRDSTFIPLGYDRHRWQGIRPKRKPCGKGVSLVYVGLLQKQIDVRPVLEALVEREHYSFTIIGDSGEGERFGEVQDFVRKHDMQNVSFVGRLPSEEVPEYLKSQDIGVVPMISSSAMPNKVFDYIAAYLPIMVLGDNDTSNLVRQHDVGWCAPFQGSDVGHLLDSLSPSEILQKARNVEEIRPQCARGKLLETFLKLVDGCAAPH